MKKYFMILCVALMSVNAFAQKGSLWAGVDGKYSLNDEKNVGIGGKLQWQCLDHLRLEANAAYFLEKNDFQFIDTQLKAQFLINLGKENFNFYPMAGGVFRHEQRDYVSQNGISGNNKSETDDVFNIVVGAGIEFPLSQRLKLNVECNYIYLDYTTLSLGLALRL